MKRPQSVPPVRGFTLLELLAALAIAGLVLAVSVPASVRLYESMQYREAVRDVLTLFASARYTAITSGHAQDVEIHPASRELRLNNTVKQLPGDVRLSVDSARELNRGEVGIIRFYPEGGTSGGGVSIENANGSGVKITVDWLLGRVSQEKYGFN
ncbi:MAG: prepilin-type N-terminal cleavage/methylation domain-containing protein [Proteobacteria bacterium]|nr:prepilin-type N-terminal cleavage/methylation domain-containing protein [Pseudomonadota bacterium]